MEKEQIEMEKEQMERTCIEKSILFRYWQSDICTLSLGGTTLTVN